MMHLHPSSFHLLDDILSNENLKAIEINKDVGGPSITQMLPQFRKVLDKKRCLIIWGDLTEEDIQNIFDNLPPKGIFFSILLPEFAAAEQINAFLNSAGSALSQAEPLKPSTAGRIPRFTGRSTPFCSPN
jgi:hypothetical protein